MLEFVPVANLGSDRRVLKTGLDAGVRRRPGPANLGFSRRVSIPKIVGVKTKIERRGCEYGKKALRVFV